jgi:4-hydroxy-tetrahydrodipicolinate reductase
MKIAIVGYGKMGKAIEQVAQKFSIKISQIIKDQQDLINATFDKNEIAIEFTEPAICMENIKLLAEKKVNIVCGTTGWYDDMALVKKTVEQNNIGFAYSSNFSIGVNIFWRTVEQLAKLMNSVEDYDVAGHEIHHNHKKDSPSGTAIHTAEILLKNLDRKSKVLTQTTNDREILPEELHFTSARLGNVIGKHSVIFDSIYDTIEITHNSKSRECYAIGAIKTAKWLCNKKGFFDFQKHMEEIGNVKF